MNEYAEYEIARGPIFIGFYYEHGITHRISLKKVYCNKRFVYRLHQIANNFIDISESSKRDGPQIKLS